MFRIGLLLTLIFQLSLVNQACGGDNSPHFFVTNFSTESLSANIPIILAAAAEDTGHLLTIRAQNRELGFSGYRLYVGASAEAARSATTGTECSWPLSNEMYSIQQYKIEVKPGATTVIAGTSDRLCAVPLQLTSGQWVVLRALQFKDIVTVTPGEPSNAFQIP